MHMRILMLTIGALVAATSTSAQELEKQPLKWFFPSSTFDMSGIETVNTSNGGLTVRIPLVSMPPGRGGFAPGINLVYNSKQWQAAATVRTVRSGNAGNCHENSGMYCTLSQVDGGAWRYGIQYGIRR